MILPDRDCYCHLLGNSLAVHSMRCKLNQIGVERRKSKNSSRAFAARRKSSLREFAENETRLRRTRRKAKENGFDDREMRLA